MEVAKNIQDAYRDGSQLTGHAIRTPGYPVLVFTAAEHAEVELSEVSLPNRNWHETNDQGKELVRQVIQYQSMLGFAIPLLLYGIALALGASALLAVVVSLSYFVDIAAVSFQYVMLNETLSILLMLSCLYTLAIALKCRSILWAVFAGLVTGMMLLTRAPLAVLSVLFSVSSYLILRHAGSTRRKAAGFIAVYLGVAAVFPLAWSFVNLQTTGHFFFTQNGTVTLQNFAARRFVRMEIDDAELKVLQKHASNQLELARENGLKDYETYAFTRSFPEVQSELAIEDPMYLYSLASRANRITILSHPLEFVSGNIRRWAQSWLLPLSNVKNRYALERISELGVASLVFGKHGYMLFGSATLFLFLILPMLAARSMPYASRIFFLTAFAFVIAYTAAVTMADENEAIRHAMQARILVNAMLLVSCSLLMHRWIYNRRGPERAC